MPSEGDTTLDMLVRDALTHHGNLAVDISSLGVDDDLYLVGLTSHATINVMIAIEDATGTQFHEHLMRRSTFKTIDAIKQAATESAQPAQPHQL
jgi:acyl carrier protein